VVSRGFMVLAKVVVTVMANVIRTVTMVKEVEG
jgi:hypothetical protein